MTVPYTGSTTVSLVRSVARAARRGKVTRRSELLRPDRCPCPTSSSRSADGRDVTAVWLNELGGVTFSLGRVAASS